MDGSREIILSGSRCPAVAPVAHPNLGAAVEEWLRSQVANGDPREDTIKGYQQDIRIWMTWCQTNGVDPGRPTRLNVEAYRSELIAAGMAPATISRKLSVIRRFYQSAKDRGMIEVNPVAGVKPPVDRRVKDRKKSLSAGQAERLIEALPPGTTVKGLRDRVVVGLMLLEGLRRVELHRANVEDIEEGLLGPRLLVHGKIRDRHKFPRRDTMETIEAYLAKRGPVPQELVKLHNKDVPVTPLICSIDRHGNIGGRIARVSLNYIIDGYLAKAGIKKSQLSCHALRHTFGTLLYQKTKDLRAVQDELGHANIATTAIYADSGMDERRFSEEVPLSLKGE